MNEKSILVALAAKLTAKGTRPTRRGFWQRRDWRKVAARYLRRFAPHRYTTTGSRMDSDWWYVGGHHVARPNGGHGIAERVPHSGTPRGWYQDPDRRIAVDYLEGA